MMNGTTQQTLTFIHQTNVIYIYIFDLPNRSFYNCQSIFFDWFCLAVEFYTLYIILLMFFRTCFTLFVCEVSHQHTHKHTLFCTLDNNAQHKSHTRPNSKRCCTPSFSNEKYFLLILQKNSFVLFAQNCNQSATVHMSSTYAILYGCIVLFVLMVCVCSRIKCTVFFCFLLLLFNSMHPRNLSSTEQCQLKRDKNKLTIDRIGEFDWIVTSVKKKTYVYKVNWSSGASASHTHIRCTVYGVDVYACSLCHILRERTYVNREREGEREEERQSES